MKKNLFLSVEPGDIFMFGDMTFWPKENNGNTAFTIFDSGRRDWNMSYILLRTILQTIGEEYKVWRIADYEDESHDLNFIFYTNMPKDVYETACKQSLLNPQNPDETCIWADDVLTSDGSEDEPEDEPEDDQKAVLLSPYINIVDYETMKSYSTGWHSMGGETIEVEKLKVDYPISVVRDIVFPVEKKAYTVEELLKTISYVVCAEIVKGNNFAPHALEDYVIEEIRVSRGVAEVVFGS